MKKLSMWVAAMLPVVAFGLFEMTIYLPNSAKPDLMIKASELDNDTKTGKFVAEGSVKLENYLAGISVNATKVSGKYSNVTESKKTKTVLDNATLESISKFEQKGKDKDGSDFTYKLKTTKAIIKSLSSEASGLSIPGDLVLDTVRGQKLWTIKGSSAEAQVYKEKKVGSNGLISASVKGPITFDGSEVAELDGKEITRKYTAKADSLVFKRTPTGAEITLSGNITAKRSSSVDDGPELMGATKVILYLDEQDQIVRTKATSDGSSMISIKKKAPGQ